MKRTLSFLLTLVMVGSLVFSVLPISAAGTSNLPKAPTSLVYRLDKVGEGMAEGVVSITLPAGHGADDIYLYWANDEGKLEGYSALTPIKVGGNVVTHRMVKGTFVPFGATRLLAYSYADGAGFSDECASFRLPEGAAMSEDYLGKLYFEFQSVSDMHVTAENSGREHCRDNFRIMLEDINKISPNSIGIFNNGDTVNSATDADYIALLEIYNSFENVPPLYSAFGNHEVFRYGLPPAANNFPNMKAAYQSFLGGFIPENASFSGGARFSSLSFSFEENGCKFIFLGTDVLDQNNQTLSSTTLAWLEEELEKAVAPDTPIFIITHQPMNNTLAGTFSGSSKYKKGAAYGAVTAETETALKRIFSKYPQIILFAGHTHFDMNSYGIHYVQDKSLPSMFGTSGVGYPASTYDKLIGESGKKGEGYYVYVYGDKVLVCGRNFNDGEWIASAQFMVDLSEEGLATPATKEVRAPMYGSIPTLNASGNVISGSIECHLPIHNNATEIALFFSSADTGIIGDHPIATHTVNSNASGTYDVEVLASLPENADYILLYSYSDEMGWSADYDVIDIKEYTKGGGAPASGAFSMNKYSFVEGEPIYVTAHAGVGEAWIGIRNTASSDYRTWNYWKVVDVGLGTAVDITKDHTAFGRAYTALEPGVYEIGWIANSGAFLTDKKPENTTTFVVHKNGNVSSSGAIKTDRSVYRVGEPIYVTATKGTDADWVGIQLSSATSGTKLWYSLKVSGVNQAFDITKQSNFTGVNGTDYKYVALEPGEYQIGWISSANSTFQSGKTAENMVTITVVKSKIPRQIGVPNIEVIPNANFSTLLARIKEAEKLRERHYTADSWQTMMSALEAAKLLFDEADPSQKSINQAAAALTSAIAALERLTVDRPVETTPVDDTPKKGCGSSVGILPMAIMLSFIPVVIKRKKR